jgi:hypothetical protein
LVKNSTASAFRHTDAHRDIAMASDEDNGNFHPGITRSPLQIKPIESRQPHIEHQAAGHVSALAPQELLSRGEELGPQPNRPNEVLE